MKKKPKVLELSLFALQEDVSNETQIPYIKSLCNRFGTKELNALWNHHWKELNTTRHIFITGYLNEDILLGDWKIKRPHVYLLRVMVLHDFCELYGYKLKDIKYA